MDKTFTSFNINSVDHQQQQDFIKQQKEIESMLASAFDDITSIPQLSDHEDDINDNDNSIMNNIDHILNHNKLINGFDHSTPLNHNRIKPSTSIQPNGTISNGKPLSKYAAPRNISDIPEEDTIIDVESIQDDDDDGRHSDLSLSTDNNNMFPTGASLIDYLQNGYNNHRSPLLEKSKMDDDVQLKEDLYHIKEEFAQINSNYELLQNKYHNLQQMNDKNVGVIDVLRARVKQLEKQLKEEKEISESERRKASMFESKVLSLEYQLSELQKGDYLAKNNEEQMKLFESMKMRHLKELNNLRNDYDAKIDKLTQTIQAKDDELIDNCNIILKYKQEADYFQKQTLNKENEFKTKLQQEIKAAKDQTELRLLKSFDESMNKLKTDWEQKLQEDIDKIVNWLDNWDDDQAHTTPSIEQLDIRFGKLIDVCECLKRSTMKREQQIQTQIDKMEQAKRQLERALLEVRMRNTSLSSNSSRSDLVALEQETQTNNQANQASTSSSAYPIIKKSQSNGAIKSSSCSPSHQLDTPKMISALQTKYEKELKDMRQQFETEMDLLRIQLLNKEEETSLLKRKSNKYKQHYQLLIDKHKQELNLLKTEFTKVMQDLMNNRTS